MHHQDNSGKINLPSQPISFVNKISLILKATSDDEIVTPGYLYKDINDISYESVGYSESLVEFLTDRLKNNSCHVKFKVLRLIKHLIDNGSREFKLGIRRHSSVIQECTKFGGPPHPMHGNTPYLMVRKIATEVCESLYNMVPEGVRSPADVMTSEKPPELKYGGLGPVRTGGSIQGFGNTPINQNKSISDTILGGLEKLGAKMTETPSTRQAALLANLDMSGSTRNYQPPSLPPSVYPGSTHGDSLPKVEDPASDSVLMTRRPAKKPTPGKAGGGWGDDEDEDEEDENGSSHKVLSANQSSIDTDSLADLSGQPQTDAKRIGDAELQADWTSEQELLTKTLATGSTGPGGELLSPSNIAEFTDQAANLCCPLLVELLSQRLIQSNHGVALRALQLLEGIIYNTEELVAADNVTSICRGALVSCFMASQASSQNVSEKDSSNKFSPDDSAASGQTDESAIGAQKDVDKPIKGSVECSSLVNALYVKSAKLILSLQQLSSFTEILPANNFKGFVSVD